MDLANPLVAAAIMRQGIIIGLLDQFDCIGMTPYIRVDSTLSYCDVPKQYADDKGIVTFNLSENALSYEGIMFYEYGMCFTLSISGEQYNCNVPYNAIEGIYAKEAIKLSVFWQTFEADIDEATSRDEYIEKTLKPRDTSTMNLVNTDAPKGNKNWKPRIVK